MRPLCVILGFLLAGSLADAAPKTPATVKLTAEGVLLLDPDVIVDLFADIATSGRSEEEVRADWRSIPGARAVAAGRVHVVTAMYAVRPGPRFISLVEDLARMLHPEADWGRP